MDEIDLKTEQRQLETTFLTNNPSIPFDIFIPYVMLLYNNH